jgi:hypothetical protein
MTSTIDFISTDDLVNKIKGGENLMRKYAIDLLKKQNRYKTLIKKIEKEIKDRNEYKYLIPFISNIVDEYQIKNKNVNPNSSNKNTSKNISKKLKRKIFNSIISIVRKNVNKDIDRDRDDYDYDDDPSNQIRDKIVDALYNDCRIECYDDEIFETHFMDDIEVCISIKVDKFFHKQFIKRNIMKKHMKRKFFS